ncbi:MAG: hypothetical protein ACOH5I_21185 [Oligoflexus sp.]
MKRKFLAITLLGLSATLFQACGNSQEDHSELDNWRNKNKEVYKCFSRMQLKTDSFGGRLHEAEAKTEEKARKKVAQACEEQRQFQTFPNDYRCSYANCTVISQN